MMPATIILADVLSAAPDATRVQAELAAAEAAKLAVVLHVAETNRLGGAEILKLRDEARASLTKSRLAPVRKVGALVLKHFGNIDDAPPLSRLLLLDPDDTVRAEAAYALGSVGDVRSIAPLVKAFGPDGNESKRACIDGIRAIGERTGQWGKVTAALELLLKRTTNPNDQVELRRALTWVAEQQR